MTRRALLLITALYVGLAAQDATAAALLRSKVVVDGDVVKLGDLFDDIGDKADIVVAHAPTPGHRMTVDADWLQAVASRNDLGWHPEDDFAEAVIIRSADVVPPDQIDSALLDALKTQTAVGDAPLIDIDNRDFRIVVPSGHSPQLTVRDLTFDNRTQRFSATLEYASDINETSQIHVSGHLAPTVEIPLLTRNITKGETISAQDLTWTRVRQTTLRRDALVDADQIIGMTPRQSLRANQMILANEIQRPVIVARGALVTMVLRYGAMSLTAQGHAIDQGSLGDVIHLTNSHSNLPVEGVIDGPNHVAISMAGTVALAN